MRWSRGNRTRRLATAELEFSTDRRLRDALHAVTVAGVIVAGLAVAAWLYSSGRVPAARLAELERENASLKAELARARTDLEFERSTRAALTSQVAELSQRAGDLKSQVEFFNAQSGRGSKAR
jgi:hypothetical protein